LRGVSAGHLLPLSLAGAPRSQPIPAFGNYVFPGNPATAQDRLYKLQGMYAGEPPPLGPSAINTLETIDLMDTIPFGAYTPAGGAQYPDTIFGNRMRNIAALIKADVGIEVIHIDFGSWDHHVQQGPLDGDLAAKIDELARSLEAFYLDLLAMIGEVTLVCLSEFGRKVEENSSLGTDHGHGNVMMMMGGGIQGGQVFADWPGLAPAQLNFGDLAVTMDYRDLLGEILTQRLGATDLGAIFPEHTFTTHGVTV
jgi:uncharacterized protein (DUF1501 family)